MHKNDPCNYARTLHTRTWKKKGESLKRQCKAKGKKEGVGGKMARFMVAIAYDKGIVKSHHYNGPVNAEFCKSFIEEHFPEMFDDSANPNGKFFAGWRSISKQ